MIIIVRIDRNKKYIEIDSSLIAVNYEARHFGVKRGKEDESSPCWE